ncbi:MAG: cytochrome c [Vicinamibacterales bacterium]
MRAFHVVAMIALVAGAGALAQAPSVRDGIYTAAQAEQGQAVYDEQCVSCHGPVTAFVPEMAALLADHTFRNRWRGRSLGEMFELIRDTMPQDAPGSLSPQQSAELVAYILSGNRLPAGDLALTDDVERLGQIMFEP